MVQRYRKCVRKKHDLIVCVYVCVCVREREREILEIFIPSQKEPFLKLSDVFLAQVNI